MGGGGGGGGVKWPCLCMLTELSRCKKLFDQILKTPTFIRHKSLTLYRAEFFNNDFVEKLLITKVD